LIFLSSVGRQGFNFVIAFLVFVWGFVAFFLASGALLTMGGVVVFSYVLLPALGFADILCYVAGYITTWERQGGVILG
jgi:hypothetical protein